jgi:hypothetical protein
MQGQQTGLTPVRQRMIWSLCLLPIVLLIWIVTVQPPYSIAIAITKTTITAPISTTISNTYIITGQVSFDDDQPVEGAMIYTGDRYSVTTDSNGVYTMTGLLTGTYTIRGVKESGSPYTIFFFEPESRTVSVPPSASDQDFSVGTIAVDYGMGGDVTDGDGVPIAGVTMLANGLPTATTNSSGAFFWFPVAVGTYTLTPRKHNYVFNPAVASVTVPPGLGVHFTGTVQFKQYFLPSVIQNR